MENNFNLRDFLYNNTLLTEGMEVEESSKVKKSELKEKIKSEILSTLSEDEDEDEGTEGTDSTEDDLDAALDSAEDDQPAEEPGAEGPEFSDDAGLNSEETDIQNNLKKAYDAAVSIGDQKLANQISNTITFFTRAHVAPTK